MRNSRLWQHYEREYRIPQKRPLNLPRIVEEKAREPPIAEPESKNRINQYFTQQRNVGNPGPGHPRATLIGGKRPSGYYNYLYETKRFADHIENVD